jgi:hypothetical protein
LFLITEHNGVTKVSLVNDGQKIPSKRRGSKKPTESQTKVALAIQNKVQRKKARTIFDNTFDDNKPERARIRTQDDFACNKE